MTQKQIRMMLGSTAGRTSAAAAFVLVAAVSGAQQQAQPRFNPSALPSAPQYQMPKIPAPPAITPNGAVVEDVIARVNDQIITRSEYERSQEQLLQEAEQTKMPPADLQDRQENLLRDMIDQQLLLSKGKELGITGDAETIRQLDEMRKQNHLDSMEALQKAAEAQGVSYEDFKQQIRNRVITQSVVRDEVGRRLNMTKAQEQVYYDAHKQEFEVPEQVHLSEILIPTPENATDAQVAAAQAKADAVIAKLKGGASFADVAKTDSGGPTATAGGDLGDFKRGQLGMVLEDATFNLPKGGTTAPIRTRQGFVILKVDEHQAAGVPPLTDPAVEQQVQEAIYVDALQPALRAYLTKARNEAYLDIKPGFIDTGSNKKEVKPTFTSYAPPPIKKKIVAKQKAEQEKAAAAQAALAAARAKVAEKAAEKAADNARKAGVKNVAGPTKAPKIHREKIRYGQAPTNSLPVANATIAENNAPLQGQAPGAAMAASDAAVITTGTGADANDDPLAPKQVADHKSRYSDREKQVNEEKLKTKVAKTTVKATTHPVTATTQEAADEKQQAAPLGLNGDTKKKVKKTHQKGEPKERMQEQPTKPVEPTVTPAPTVNPNLATSPVAPKASTTPSADQTTLPPSYTPAPGASPAGQPLPATTSADPNAPVTTPAPH